MDFRCIYRLGAKYNKNLPNIFTNFKAATFLLDDDVPIIQSLQVQSADLFLDCHLVNLFGTIHVTEQVHFHQRVHQGGGGII
jgi:hypothetical protein